MKELGYSTKIIALIGEDVNPDELARVIAEHKERYKLQNDKGVFNAEITGNMRFSASSRSELPAVGDWVRITMMDEQNAIILELFPRFSVLERQAVNRTSDSQIIAANIDHAFIVMAAGQDFNLNRMERYLVICRAGKINPIVLLTKTDLVTAEEKEKLLASIGKRARDIRVIAISNETLEGIDDLQSSLLPYETYCFVGSSGVGKSTIINKLNHTDDLKTGTLSTSTGKGKHTTSHRELIILPNESIVIDTPGMRELGMVSSNDGLEETFDEISALAKKCRYSNCTHESEDGCAILQAIEEGDLSVEIYQNYMKLRREQEHFERTVYEKRQKGREFGKMVKEVSKFKKNNKF